MSIVSKIYDIADKIAGETVTRQGNTIVAAIDALNDALAGSDQPAARSVTEALSLLAQTIEGSGETYALTTADEISINSGAMNKYTADSPGTVHPGDVLTWMLGREALINYYGDPDGEPLLHLKAGSPYTVQSVDGATLLIIDNGAPV